MTEYRVKTEHVEAVQYDGNNKIDVENFVDMALVNDENDVLIFYKGDACLGFINVHEWVIKNKSDKGFHVCSPKVFEAIYEPLPLQEKESDND